MIFCYGQYKCNTFEVFQGFIFHKFGLYHEIRPLKISSYTVLDIDLSCTVIP